MPFSYRLDKDSPMASGLLWAALMAALKTGAKVENAGTDGRILTLTFDREVSQTLIVDILSERIKEGYVHIPTVE